MKSRMTIEILNANNEQFEILCTWLNMACEKSWTDFVNVFGSIEFGSLSGKKSLESLSENIKFPSNEIRYLTGYIL